MYRRFLIAAGLAAMVGMPDTALAVSITYEAALSGAAENPPISSSGTGFATVTYSLDAHTLAVEVEFSGLTGTTTAAHIHCCVDAPGNVGVATQVPTFFVFPLGVTSGTYLNTFDLTLAASFNPAFITASGGIVADAEAALAAGLAAGRAYLNIHTTFAPAGEIRGFLQSVPEPASLALFGLGLAGLGGIWRKKLAPADARHVPATQRTGRGWAVLADGGAPQ